MGGKTELTRSVFWRRTNGRLQRTKTLNEKQSSNYESPLPKQPKNVRIPTLTTITVTWTGQGRTKIWRPGTSRRERINNEIGYKELEEDRQKTVTSVVSKSEDIEVQLK